MRRFCVVAALTTVLAMVGCGRAASRPSQPDPTTPASTRESSPFSEPPPPHPLPPVQFPPVHERTLANGVRVIVVANHEQPIVSVSLSLRTGSDADPAGKAGVATLTADLLTKGTTTRSGKQIADAIGFVGGQLDTGAGTSASTLTTTVLTEFLDTALALLANVVMHPTFPEPEIERARANRLFTIERELGQPDALAESRFLQEVYGAYRTTPTPASIRAITRADVVQFHERFYRPSNALLVVSGDVEPEAIAARLERAFSGWTAGASRRAGDAQTPALPALPAPTKRRLVVVHLPNAVQATYRIGHLMPPARNDDWPAITTMNAILGGQTGWLIQALRGQKGYAYGAYAAAQEQADHSSFAVRTEVRTAVADSALAEVLRVLERMRTEPVPAADLAVVKNLLAGFYSTIETPQQIANQVTRALWLDRPVDYLETFLTQAAALTTADIERVARTYLHPDRAVIVVVGDARQLVDKLRPFAEVVELYDTVGRPITPESLSGP